MEEEKDCPPPTRGAAAAADALDEAIAQIERCLACLPEEAPPDAFVRQLRCALPEIARRLEILAPAAGRRQAATAALHASVDILFALAELLGDGGVEPERRHAVRRQAVETVRRLQEILRAFRPGPASGKPE